MKALAIIAAIYTAAALAYVLTSVVSAWLWNRAIEREKRRQLEANRARWKMIKTLIRENRTAELCPTAPDYRGYGED